MVAAMVVDAPLPAVVGTVAAMAVHVPLPVAAVMVEVATAVDALRAVAALAADILPPAAAAIMVAEGVPPRAVQLRATTVEDSRIMDPIAEGTH
jgi:hypothetical protein